MNFHIKCHLLYCRLIFFFVFIWMPRSLVFSQQDVRFIENYIRLYNEKKFQEIPILMHEDFFKEISSRTFVLTNRDLFITLGKISRWEKMPDSAEVKKARVFYENGMMIWEFRMKNQKPDGFFIRNPWFGEIVPKRKTPLARSFQPQTPWQRAVDSICERFMESEKKCGLAVGIRFQGKDYFFYYGETKKNSGILPSDSSLFEIGSVTKVFTSYLFALAVSEGKLDMQTPLKEILLKNFGIQNDSLDDKITLKHLTNHTSGFPRLPENFLDQKEYSARNPYKNYNRELLKEYLKNARNIHPTSDIRYSNLGPSVLGFVLENVYGDKYENLVKEKIFRPAGMHHSFVHSGHAPAKWKMTGYGESGEEVSYFDFDAMAPAGSVVSCLPDMIKFLRFMSDTANAVCRRMMQKSLSNQRFNIGMGWFIQPSPGKNTLIWHNGATYGFTSFAGFIPEKGISLVLLNNQAAVCDKPALDILKILEKIFN